jgi:hypothetical protein
VLLRKTYRLVCIFPAGCFSIAYQE